MTSFQDGQRVRVVNHPDFSGETGTVRGSKLTPEGEEVYNVNFDQTVSLKGVTYWSEFFLPRELEAENNLLQ